MNRPHTHECMTCRKIKDCPITFDECKVALGQKMQCKDCAEEWVRKNCGGTQS